jgi:hypothetical protein
MFCLDISVLYLPNKRIPGFLFLITFAIVSNRWFTFDISLLLLLPRVALLCCSLIEKMCLYQTSNKFRISKFTYILLRMFLSDFMSSRGTFSILVLS